MANLKGDHFIVSNKDGPQNKERISSIEEAVEFALKYNFPHVDRYNEHGEKIGSYAIVKS